MKVNRLFSFIFEIAQHYLPVNYGSVEPNMLDLDYMIVIAYETAVSHSDVHPSLCCLL